MYICDLGKSNKESKACNALLGKQADSQTSRKEYVFENQIDPWLIL